MNEALKPCHGCGTPQIYANGIDYFCPNRACRYQAALSHTAQAGTEGEVLEAFDRLKMFHDFALEKLGVGQVSDLETIRRALTQAPACAEWRPTHRHKKTGGEYELIGPALAQVNTASMICDEDDVYVYRSFFGQLFVRPCSEFNDGRFEELPAAPAPSDEEGE